MLWKGRSKVIVRPDHHQRVDTHGIFFNPDEKKGAVHIHPAEGHFMEWPHLNIEHNVTKRAPEAFTVEKEEEVHIHEVAKAFKANVNGTYTVEHDGNLQEWFHKIINRAYP